MDRNEHKYLHTGITVVQELRHGAQGQVFVVKRTPDPTLYVLKVFEGLEMRAFHTELAVMTSVF